MRLAGTAQEYLQFLDVPAPTCVLIDVRLLGMDGPGLLDELRRSREWLCDASLDVEFDCSQHRHWLMGAERLDGYAFSSEVRRTCLIA